MSSQIIIDYPQDNSQGIPTIGIYDDRSTVTINGTSTQSITIEGNYLSGSIVFNNNNTTLYAGFGADTVTFDLCECTLFNEPMPKGDILSLTCNTEGSATITYQFSDVVII